MRRAYNLLETMVEGMPKGGVLSEEEVAVFAQERGVHYDRGEDEHYDTASALIKSMRGNDPDAAVYWLAKMLAGGRSPLHCPQVGHLCIRGCWSGGLPALLMADAAFRACETIGLPECELNLAHVVLFRHLPKEQFATLAIGEAKRALREQPMQSVPSSISDRHGRNRKDREEGERAIYTVMNFPRIFPGNNIWRSHLNSTGPNHRVQNPRSWKDGEVETPEGFS